MALEGPHSTSLVARDASLENNVCKNNLNIDSASKHCEQTKKASRLEAVHNKPMYSHSLPDPIFQY